MIPPVADKQPAEEEQVVAVEDGAGAANEDQGNEQLPAGAYVLKLKYRIDYF